MAQKPSIPKGTRDFGPEQMAKRNYIFDTIKEVYKLYGFLPIETPAMENLSSLMGKYGEEGDKLLFKILNSGDFITKVPQDMLDEKNSVKLTNKISDKGLRYDLTVPFARYVVQHRNEIAFPFKRYQIQPVWRADRPQRGRYREFFQCDADVVGSDSLLNELEIIQMIDEVFRRLKVSVTIKMNNRKILAGIAETIGEADRIIDITVAIDKLDKIGIDKVNQELLDKGIAQEAVDKLQPIMELSGSNLEKLDQIEAVIGATEVGKLGVEEMRTIFEYLGMFDVETAIELDLTLARGLNYYTGAIFEVKSNDVQIGSITGGGRYDNLTGVFGMPDVSGVGISFGADRIYDVLEQLELFPTETVVSSKVMFVNFGATEERFILPILLKLRQAGIAAELYPEASKMKKQMTYANRRSVPFVILAGDREIEENMLTVKDMEKGEQHNMSPEALIEFLKDA